MPFASPLARVPRSLLLIAGLGVTTTAIAFGCGGGGSQSTSGNPFGGGGTGTSSQATNGSGGTIFQPVVGSSSTGGGDSPSGASSSGMMPVCDPNPTTGPLQWALQNTDDGAQFGLAVATDQNGYVYVTGSYAPVYGTSGQVAAESGITLGGAPKTTATQGGNAIFVAKLAPEGTPQWVKGFPVAAFGGLHPKPTGSGRGIVVNTQGDVFVIGDLSGTVNFGAGQTIKSAGTEFGDVWLLKLDGSGNTVSAARIGDPAGTPNGADSGHTARAIALLKSSSGDMIAVGGDSQGTIDIGGGKTAQSSAAGEKVAFVAVLSASNFTPQFVSILGDGAAKQETHALAFDKNKDLLITGNTQGAIQFPGGTMLTPTGMQSVFVAKLKADGSSTTWAKLYGSGTAGGEGIATDGAGNVYVTGSHKGDLDFGGGALGNGFGDNAYIAKLDGSGNHIWSYTYGDSMSQQSHGVAVDAIGHVTIAGEFTSKVDFGGGALTSAGNGDIFVAKLDTHGCQMWAHSYGDMKQQAATSVAMDPTGNVFITGSISGSVAFGSTTLTVNDTNQFALADAFVAKFGP